MKYGSLVPRLHLEKSAVGAKSRAGDRKRKFRPFSGGPTVHHDHPAQRLARARWGDIDPNTAFRIGPRHHLPSVPQGIRPGHNIEPLDSAGRFCFEAQRQPVDLGRPFGRRVYEEPDHFFAGLVRTCHLENNGAEGKIAKAARQHAGLTCSGTFHHKIDRTPFRRIGGGHFGFQSLRSEHTYTPGQAFAETHAQARCEAASSNLRPDTALGGPFGGPHGFTTAFLQGASEGRPIPIPSPSTGLTGSFTSSVRPFGCVFHTSEYSLLSARSDPSAWVKQRSGGILDLREPSLEPKPSRPASQTSV